MASTNHESCHTLLNGLKVLRDYEKPFEFLWRVQSVGETETDLQYAMVSTHTRSRSPPVAPPPQTGPAKHQLPLFRRANSGRDMDYYMD
jgi:hypothetical protein